MTILEKKLPFLSGREICWVSPLELSDFAEYRDCDFLDSLNLQGLTEDLSQFGPVMGLYGMPWGKQQTTKYFF